MKSYFRRRRCVAIAEGQVHRVQRLGKRTDLVDLNQNRVGNAKLNALIQEFRIGDKKIITYQLYFITNLFGKYFPTVPIVFAHAIFDGNDRVFRS